MLRTRAERFLLLLGSLGLIACAAVVALRRDTLPHGAQLAAALIVLSSPIAGWGLLEFLRSYLLARRLRTPRALWLKAVPRKAGDAYLGHVFPWKADHLERYLDLDRRRIETPPHQLLGDWRLHAVGGRSKPLFVPVHVLNQHKLITSTTGGGKSRALELDILQAIARGDATLVIDPKGDEGLLARTEEACRRYGRKFRFVALPYPAQSVPYNPVGSYVQVHEIADRVAQLLPSSGDSAPFAAYAWGVLNTIAQGMRLAGDYPITLYKLKSFAFGDTWALFERVLERLYPELYAKHRNSLAEWHAAGDNLAIRNLRVFYEGHRRSGAIQPCGELDDLVKLITHPKEHYQKMVASLGPKLEQLTTGHLKDLLSPEDNPARVLWWEKVDRGREVVYFFLGSLLGYTTAEAVAQMTLLDFIAYIGKRYAYHSASELRRFTVIVDEVADVINPSFVNLLNKSRGANVSIVMAAQSLSDLHAKLRTRPEALRVLANVNTLVQMLVREQSDAETFSAMTGKVRVRNLEERFNYEPSLGDAGHRSVSGHRASYSQMWRTEESDLVPPSLVQRLCIGQFFLMQNGLVYKGIIPLLPDPDRSYVDRLKGGFLAEPPPTDGAAAANPSEVARC